MVAGNLTGQGRKLKGGKVKAKKTAQAMPTTIPGSAESDAAATHMAAVVTPVISRAHWDSELLPEDLASELSNSVAKFALQAYEDRMRVGLSNVCSRVPIALMPLCPPCPST